LTWSNIGGGGTSSAGQYLLTGTIGQSNTGYSEGGNYEVLSGFWPGEPWYFVRFDDFARFAQLWLSEGGNLAGDLDNDGDIDLDDLQIFADYWLLRCPSNWPLK
jgi:hypothetical protein